MLQNAYLDAKIGVDPAENEPRKEWCVVAENTHTAQRLGDGPGRDAEGAHRREHGAHLHKRTHVRRRT